MFASCFVCFLKQYDCKVIQDVNGNVLNVYELQK
jgi:hypothetical protein